MMILYGLASISMLLKIIGLFCKRALQKRQYSANVNYNFKEPNNRSHPIHVYIRTHTYVRTHIFSVSQCVVGFVSVVRGGFD